MRKLPLAVFLFAGTVELLSYAGWRHPTVLIILFMALASFACALAVADLRWLYGLVLIEGVIGSHGRLAFIEVGGFALSLRMALFAILVIGWLIHAMRGCARIMHFRHVHVTGPLLLLLVAVSLGLVRGWSLGAGFGEMFNDANGYAFLLLIPIGLDLFAEREKFVWLLRSLSGAAAWLAVKSLVLLFLFSHAFDGVFLRDVFLWQRKFGLTEITHLAGGAVRVFAASDLALLPAVFLGLLLAWQGKERRVLYWTSLVMAAFLLSMSRSFWLGALVAAGFMLPVFLRFEPTPLKSGAGLIKTGLTGLTFALLTLITFAFYPVPQPVQDASAWSIYGARLGGSDAAVSSRWNMLAPLQEKIAASPLFGQGFGAQITYQSDDPRMHDLYPGGKVTTSAIEWQYLEIWLKMGLLGLAAIAWLWWRTGLLFWKAYETAQGSDRLAAFGLMLSFLAFVMANIFTPYVNHPLGWMFLSFVIVGLHAVSEHDRPEHHARPRPVPLRG